jgi:hypothetical protein
MRSGEEGFPKGFPKGEGPRGLTVDGGKHPRVTIMSNLQRKTSPLHLLTCQATQTATISPSKDFFEALDLTEDTYAEPQPARHPSANCEPQRAKNKAQSTEHRAQSTDKATHTNYRVLNSPTSFPHRGDHHRFDACFPLNSTHQRRQGTSQSASYFPLIPTSFRLPHPPTVAPPPNS